MADANRPLSSVYGELISARDSEAVATDVRVFCRFRGTCLPVRYGESYDESRAVRLGQLGSM
jgi:hypothetical protein